MALNEYGGGLWKVTSEKDSDILAPTSEEVKFKFEELIEGLGDSGI